MTAERSCPVCHTSSRGATVVHSGNVDPARLNEFSYASRKTPEFMNHDLVRCPTCDLVYVPAPPSRDELASSYHVAAYDSSEEAEDAATAYLRAMESVLRALAQRGSVLEIGTGTGVLLEQLATVGFRELVGIEPSLAAIDAAPPHRRSWILPGVFEEQDLAPESFDLVCCFMTLEHVLDPKVLADAAHRVLRPGGAFVTVTHDHRALVNRVLGRRSPIVDIEHMQLFSERSVRHLFEVSGFERVTATRFVNRYALDYWWRLAPVPAPVHGWIASALRASRLDRVKVGLDVGNTMAAGFKPATPQVDTTPNPSDTATGI